MYLFSSPRKDPLQFLLLSPILFITDLGLDNEYIIIFGQIMTKTSFNQLELRIGLFYFDIKGIEVTYLMILYLGFGLMRRDHREDEWSFRFYGINVQIRDCIYNSSSVFVACYRPYVR